MSWPSRAAGSPLGEADGGTVRDADGLGLEVSGVVAGDEGVGDEVAGALVGLGLLVHPLGVGDGRALAPGVAVPQPASSATTAAATNVFLVALTPL